MNIVTVREAIKRLRAHALSAQALHEFLHAPVFLYNRHPETLTVAHNQLDAGWIQEHLAPVGAIGVPTRAPYPAFVLVDEAEHKRVVILVRLGKANDTAEDGRPVVSLLHVWNLIPEDGNVVYLGYTGAKEDGVIARYWKNGKSQDARCVKDLSWVAASMMAIVKLFCFEVMSKTSAVVKVSPRPTAGKSTEWHLARTHYCILQKREAMKLRDQKSGVTAHTIKRAAHWRMAHFRTLRSEKFKHKRGQRVPVAEAWVGPEEWTGLDQKIYKVEPVSF